MIEEAIERYSELTGSQKQAINAQTAKSEMQRQGKKYGNLKFIETR